MESTMEHVYGGWDMNSTTTNWDIFSQNSKNSPSTTTYGCGNVHFPPNADSDYDYSNTKSVKTDCDEFTINWPTIDKKASIKTVTCSTWGCTERGYQDWWYTHLPAYEGIAPDGVYANWWIYFSDPNTALTKAVCTKTCSNKSCGQSDGCGGICIVDTSCKTKENSCIDDHTLRQYSASSCSSKGVCSDSYTDLTCTYGCNTTEVACNPQPDDNTPPVVPPIDTNNTGNTNTQQNTTTQNDLSTIMELIQSNIIAILIVGGAVITLTAIVILLYIFRKKMFSSFNRKQEIKNDVETPTKA